MYEGSAYKIISYPLLALSKGIVGFGFVGMGYLFYFAVSYKTETSERTSGIVASIAKNI